MGAPRHFLIDKERLTTAAFYWVSTTSGVLTTIAAGSASAGHLFAARFAPSGAGANKLFHVTHLRLIWQTIEGFAAAQELSMSAVKLTSYTVAHTGGSAVTPLPLAPTYGASQLACRMAGTSELTAGTHTVSSQIARASYGELNALSTTPKGWLDEQLPMFDDPHPVIVLGANEGLLVRNVVLMGASGTGRLTINLGGYERNNA